MALFRFRIRSPERDRETDAGRLQRLQQSLVDIRVEMERERAGLRDRYERIAADAAFSLQRMEDGRAGGGVSLKINDMTDAMIRYTSRLASLQTQIDFVTEVGEQVAAFSQDYEGDKAVA